VIRRLTTVLVPLVLVAGIAAAVLGDRGDQVGPDEATLEVAEGLASVTTSAGIERRVTDRVVVAAGDVVEVDEGAATLRFADGATYELRQRDGVGSRIEVGSPPRLLEGDVLVSAGFPARLVVGAASLSALGALEVDAATEVAAAYEGRTEVAGTGEVTELPRLRQLVLVPGATPEPVTFDGTDPWDRRYLGEAIAFGERLEALARGYTSDLPQGGGRTADFFRAVLAPLADVREFGDDLLDPARPLGDELVGAAIAVQGEGSTFRERWDEVFSFRAAGAAWGLVALDQDVSSAPLLEAVELAVSTSVEPEGSDPDGSDPDRPAANPGDAPTGTSRPGGAPTTSTPPAPPPDPAPEPSDGLLEPATDPASDVVGGLLDGTEADR